jgi:hypothetical protein
MHPSREGYVRWGEAMASALALMDER